ncbi:zinc finger and BTB domain-containing protein 49 isoform X2 [Cavia porcellus]
MYTSHLDLNQDNVQVMLDTAQGLQVQNVLNLCHAFLKSASVEQPSLPCGSSFSLQGALPPDTTCVLNESYPPPLLPECPVDTPHGKVLEDMHAPALPVGLHHATGEMAKQASDVLDGSCPELPGKQPGYCYKLRDFYSKQYYKQAACPSHERGAEQPFVFPSSTDLPVVETQSCTVSHSEGLLESSEHLPSAFLAPPLSDAAPDADADTPCQQPTKQMQLKKAVHLKKLNFLKSHKLAERSSEPKSGDGLTKGPESGENAGERAGSHSTEAEASGALSSEPLHSGPEVEVPEAPATVEEQSQSLQPQRQYACELCGKPFKHPSNLELHRRSHTGEKPFECNICGKHFSQAGNLQTHLRRHSGEKPYICEICGKRFAASGDVQRHIIIHSGEKPHLCDTCGRGFSNFSNLKEHKKTHTADKVFTCDECGKSFNMQRKLVKHRVRHTGERPYSCSACGKCFGGSGDLRRHVRTHTGEKPYTCEVCGKCFTRSAVLRRHKRMHGKAGGDGSPDALRGLGPAIEVPDADRSRSSDSFSQDVAGTLVPGPGRLPGHTADASMPEFDGHPADGGYCKLHAAVPVQGTGVQEKASPGLEPGKLAPPPAYAYADVGPPAGGEPLQADGLCTMRSSLAALDNHCGDPLGSRTASAAYRTSEGPFFSSMTLWGLAMKTLQNEHELDQ